MLKRVGERIGRWLLREEIERIKDEQTGVCNYAQQLFFLVRDDEGSVEQARFEGGQRALDILEGRA